MWIKSLIPWLLVAAASACAYGPGLNGYFLADDFGLVETMFNHGKPDLLGQLWDFVRPRSEVERVFPALFYRPVWHLSVSLDVWAWGVSPVALHTTSLILHIANVWLLYTVCRKCTGHRLYAAIAAGLFCCFPTNYEAVIWIAARCDLLCLFFQLLSLNMLLREDGKLMPRNRQLLALIPVWLALSSKEAGLHLPFVLLALVWLASRRAGQERAQATMTTVRTGYPVMVLLVLYLLVRFLLIGTLLGGYKDHWTDVGSASAFLLQRYSTLRPLLTPVWAPSGDSILSLVMEIGSLAALGMGLFAAWLNGALRWYVFCALWLVGSLVPLLRFGFEAELQSNMRMMYSPAAAYVALLAFSIVQFAKTLKVSCGLSGRFARISAVGTAVLLAGLFFSLLLTNQEPYVRAGRLSARIVKQGSHLLQQEPQVVKVLYDLPAFLDQAPLCLNAGMVMFNPPFGTGSNAPYRAYSDHGYAEFLNDHVIRVNVEHIAYYRYNLAAEQFVRAPAPEIVHETGHVVAGSTGGLIWKPRGIPVLCPNRPAHEIAYKQIAVDALLVEARGGPTMVIARVVDN